MFRPSPSSTVRRRVPSRRTHFRSRRGAALIAEPCPKSARGRRSRRGVALVMVLVVTTILTAVAADLSNESQVNLHAAANARDELQAHFHARSALELEFFVLRLQDQLKGTLGQILPIPLFELSGMFVSSDTVKGILREGDEDFEDAVLDDSQRSFAKELPIGDFLGSFWVEEVVDENRKFNINHLNNGVRAQKFTPLILSAIFAHPKYDPLFELLGESRDPVRNRVELIARMIDWVDANGTTDPVTILTRTNIEGGAEDAYYTQLPYDAEYRPKNGKFMSLEELRLVPYVNDAFMQLFSKYFTVWSDNDGVSMRTAEPSMIRGVIQGILSRPVEPFDEERFAEFFEQWTLLTAVPGGKQLITPETLTTVMTQVGLPVDAEKLKQMTDNNIIRFDDASTVFKITAVGRVNDASSRLTVVWRQGEIKYWRED